MRLVLGFDANHDDFDHQIPFFCLRRFRSTNFGPRVDLESLGMWPVLMIMVSSSLPGVCSSTNTGELADVADDHVIVAGRALGD